MASKHFPLRWESTGDQWWFASPIDWAAANGQYDVVRELLYVDPNLLIKLTSLPRIKRLETVWDDLETPNNNSSNIAKSRSLVAKNLYRECESSTKKKGHNNNYSKNSLIRAGYGGWLLYTAASAGDLPFIEELLDRDPMLVFGEGEYGVTDILYAAARSKSREVFKAVFDCSLSLNGMIVVKEGSSVFRDEMMNRAVHALARGGNVEVLSEFLRDFGGGDVLNFKDAQGSTVLHSAAGRGQIQVVKYLISSYNDIVTSEDNHGNTALHVAAYHGHLPVLNLLISSSPSSALAKNNYGDTILHMAISGFKAPNFRRLDQQVNLVNELINGTNLSNIEDIINVQNKDGRTPLHLAVIENIQSDVVELLMSARGINLNICDRSRKTPLSILKQKPYSASSEILIKRLISAGGVLSDCQDQTTREAMISCLKMSGIRVCPGTSFKIPDSEILLYAGSDDFDPSSCGYTSMECGYSGEIERVESKNRRRFNILLRWAGKKVDNKLNNSDDNCSVESYKTYSSSRNTQIPLRQQFLKQSSSLPNNKRVQCFVPSPLTRRRFAEGLRHGVLRVTPKSPSSAFSESTLSSPGFVVDKRKDVGIDSCEASSCNQSPDIGKLEKTTKRYGSLNLKLMNNYFCFGAQGLRLQKSNITIESPPQSPSEQSVVV